MRRAVFLDRDGTIARDVHYCRCLDDFVLLPGVPQAIGLLNEHGFKVVVITNQSGIARGYLTEETLHLIHLKMRDELQKHGASVDAIYFCPHHPDDNCECRKPRPTLIFKAAKDLDIDLRLSYMVGDDIKDVEAGRSAGCRTVWIAQDPSQAEGLPHHQLPDHVADSLHEATSWVARDAESRSVQHRASI